MLTWVYHVCCSDVDSDVRLCACVSDHQQAWSTDGYSFNFENNVTYAFDNAQLLTTLVRVHLLRVARIKVIELNFLMIWNFVAYAQDFNGGTIGYAYVSILHVSMKRSSLI